MPLSLRVSLMLSAATLLIGCPAGDPVEAERGASAAPASASTASTPASLEARGEYLVAIAGCNDCHTPFTMGPNGPEPDFSRMLSGHPESLVMPPPPGLPEGPWLWIGAATNTAFAGPWGVSFAINLTPDPSGIAGWDEASFIRAMRTGTHYGTSRPILPPMPWQALSRMTDEDLRAVFAYLRSIPPIENHAPEPLPPIGVGAETPAQPAG